MREILIYGQIKDSKVAEQEIWQQLSQQTVPQAERYCTNHSNRFGEANDGLSILWGTRAQRPTRTTASLGSSQPVIKNLVSIPFSYHFCFVCGTRLCKNTW
jgi:hypothetical protein